ncbi:MAG: hypothetical protein ACT4QC_00350 [Planctomycetaceae bacterium]
MAANPRQGAPHRAGDRLAQTRDTLDDQRIFGPLRTLECACGMYRGVEHRGLICDRCGVKVASPEVRRTRFGHVELDIEITRPFDPDARLSVWPVLPADDERCGQCRYALSGLRASFCPGCGAALPEE